MTDPIVGYLIPSGAQGYVLHCPSCATGWESTPVYRVNVYPYRGTCAKCKATLVEPQTPAWPELFDGRPICIGG